MPQSGKSIDDQPPATRSKASWFAMGLTVCLAITALTSLGIWQLERRIWKRELIEQVDQRIHAAPMAAPGPAEWPMLTTSHDAYRRVVVHGVFLNDRETPVRATTAHGGGYWILTPFRTDEGFVVLVNRGFVPPDKRKAATRVAIEGEHTITGLVRMAEPAGSLLRANDPAADHWYSRDVEGIAAARGFSGAAPYFIDADGAPNPEGLPIGGLTVVAFPNNHLVYALTWFSLALILAIAAATHAWQEFHLRTMRPDQPTQ